MGARRWAIRCGFARFRIGYARVSTTDQDLAIERVRLHEAGCEKLFEEKTSGAGKKRPELERLLAERRVDEVVVVTRLGGCGRSRGRTAVRLRAGGHVAAPIGVGNSRERARKHG